MRIIAALLLAICFGGAAAQDRALGQSSSNIDSSGIQATIRSQLEAFREDDSAAAYAYAAPNVREIFPTAEAFMTMVKRAYQPVYRQRSYTFGRIEERSGVIVQAVEILGTDGEYWTALYSLARQADGSWKITGCSLVKSEGGAA
jgi:Domain of unknown function (DUF4864)